MLNTYCQSLHSHACNTYRTPPILKFQAFQILDLTDKSFEVYPSYYVQKVMDYCSSVKLSFDYIGLISYFINSDYINKIGGTMGKSIYARDSDRYLAEYQD